MNKTQSISRLSFAAILLNIQKPTAIAFLARTVPTVKAACPFKDGLEKEARVEAVIGFNYQATIQARQAAKGLEADFVAKAPTWGQSVNGSPLTEHDGKHYLNVAIQKSHFPRYSVNGVAIQESAVTPYLPPKRNHTQAEAGLEKKEQVRVAKYNLKNVHAVELEGVTYELRD